MAEKRGTGGGKKIGKAGASPKKPAAKKPSVKKTSARKDPKPPTRRKAPARAAPKADSPPPRRKSAAVTERPKRSIGRRIFRGLVLAAIWGFVAVGCLVGYLYLTLPSLDEATRLKRGPTAAS